VDELAGAVVIGELVWVAVTGQTVVYRLMISVVTWPLAGQLVTVAAQEVMVYTLVVYTVEVVYSVLELELEPLEVTLVVDTVPDSVLDFDTVPVFVLDCDTVPVFVLDCDTVPDSVLDVDTVADTLEEVDFVEEIDSEVEVEETKELVGTEELVGVVITEELEVVGALELEDVAVNA